ncbi:hypothetical protein K435DRAFT_853204 [Dendrothele bispora CBS 962.96]|uniref:Uncharacterized protein n=1 Tax=Dendrothele bispora (strain CBS 962.96) TaxID=1314807 RepID=A0A4S8MHD4_DENBC|nr:hypothetical protein K435DRAFT_853204 [Dendrothele bispora CBS 962.96]
MTKPEATQFETREAEQLAWLKKYRNLNGRQRALYDYYKSSGKGDLLRLPSESPTQGTPATPVRGWGVLNGPSSIKSNTSLAYESKDAFSSPLQRHSQHHDEPSQDNTLPSLYFHDAQDKEQSYVSPPQHQPDSDPPEPLDLFFSPLQPRHSQHGPSQDNTLPSLYFHDAQGKEQSASPPQHQPDSDPPGEPLPFDVSAQAEFQVNDERQTSLADILQGASAISKLPPFCCKVRSGKEYSGQDTAAQQLREDIRLCGFDAAAVLQEVSSHQDDAEQQPHDMPPLHSSQPTSFQRPLPSRVPRVIPLSQLSAVLPPVQVDAMQQLHDIPPLHSLQPTSFQHPPPSRVPQVILLPQLSAMLPQPVALQPCESRPDPAQPPEQAELSKQEKKKLDYRRK